MLWNAFYTIFSDFDAHASEDSESRLSDLILKTLEEHIREMGELKFDNCKFTNTPSKYNNLKYLFNENEDALDWFVSYVEDQMPECFEIYLSHGQDCEFGIKHYISHYYASLLFSFFVNKNDHIDQIPTKDANFNKKFGKDDFYTFYQLMSQFAVYNACYPHLNNTNGQELYYMQQLTRC